jgi:hypothetical protein
MNTLGKVYAGLTILAMCGWVYLGGRLGKTANDWSVKLRDAKSATQKAVADHKKSELELSTAQSELARLKLGWGFEWTLPADGSKGSVQVVGTSLAVTGVGTESGLQTRQVIAEGKEQILPPTVHVFQLTTEGGSRYVGEFLADLDQLAPNSSVLRPTWAVTAQEIGAWDFATGVRLRSLVPGSGRIQVEGLNQAIQRLREHHAVADTNLKNQADLLEAAENQLAGRKAELLGNPEAADLKDRPEFKVGLVQALHDIEETRNQLQVDVDDLRRMVLEATETRNQLVVDLNELASRLPKDESRLSKKVSVTKKSP